MKIRSLSILAWITSIIVHGLAFNLSLPLETDPASLKRNMKSEKHEKKVSLVIKETRPEADPVKRPSRAKKSLLSEKSPQKKSRFEASQGKTNSKTELSSRHYSELLPQLTIEEDSPGLNHAGERKVAFPFDVNGKALEPEQERKVSYLVNSLQIPISIRRDFKETMVCTLHLKMQDQTLHLYYLNGSPYLRAEIFKQLESGEAVKNFANIMNSIGKIELFVTVKLRSVGSSRESKTDYRTEFIDDRLQILITQTYRNDKAGNVSDEIVRRQEALNVFYGRELTKSLAFRKVIRDRRYSL